MSARGDRRIILRSTASHSLYRRMRSAYVGVKLFGSRLDIPPDHRSPACQKIGTYHLAGIGRPAL